jgi:exosortase A
MVDQTRDTEAAPLTLEADWQRALLLFGGLFVLLLAAFSNAVLRLVDVWWNDVTFNHCFFVLPISAWLIWGRRRELAQLSPKREPLALLGLAAGAAGWLLAAAADVQVVEFVALVIMVIALFVGVFGRRIARLVWFPLAFLFFMVPVGTFLVAPLQDWTADFAVSALRFFGVATYLDGIMIYIPNGVFEVAEACAGLRFLIANIVIATLFAYLAYDKRWKWALFIVLGAAIPIVANGIRAFGIVYIAYVTDGRVAAGVDHIVYGWGFFTVVMLILLFVGNTFADRRVGDFPTPVLAVGHRREIFPLRGGIVAAMAALVLAGPAYAAMMIDKSAPTQAITLPALNVGGAWRAVEIDEATAWRPRYRNADAVTLQRFTNGTQTVDLFIAYYARQRQAAEAVNFANRLYDDERWRRIGGATVAIDAGGLPSVPYQVERLAGWQSRIAVNWLWVWNRFTNDPRLAKVLQTGATLSNSHTAAAVVALSAAYTENPSEAEPAIEAFLKDAEPLGTYLDRMAASADGAR